MKIYLKYAYLCLMNLQGSLGKEIVKAVIVQSIRSIISIKMINDSYVKKRMIRREE